MNRNAISGKKTKPMQNLLPLSLFCVLSNVALRRYTHTMTTDRCTPFTHQCAYTYIIQKLYVSNWSFIALLLLHVIRAWASYTPHIYYMYTFVAATAAAAAILQCMPHSISVSFHTCFAFLSVNRRWYVSSCYCCCYSYSGAGSVCTAERASLSLLYI